MSFSDTTTKKINKQGHPFLWEEMAAQLDYVYNERDGQWE